MAGLLVSYWLHYECWPLIGGGFGQMVSYWLHFECWPLIGEQ